MRCAKPVVIKLYGAERTANVMMVSNDNGTCDDKIRQAWYRFETPYGNRIPEFPMKPGMCNTMVPFWFYGLYTFRGV